MSFVIEDDQFEPEQDPNSLDNIEKVEDLPDGSSVFEMIVNEGPGEKDATSSGDDFYKNLAEDMKDGQLSGLAQKLLEDIQNDKQSRAGWEKNVNLGLTYLGFSIEEFRNVPFMRACGAFDSTLATALMEFYATARAEMFPASGPVKSEIIGAPDKETDDQGDRVKMFMNMYLTKTDRDYYPDSDRLLLNIGLYGCAFRKVYQDSVLCRPLARLVKPQDFIINHHTTSIMTSNRMTEVVRLSRKEVLLRQQSGEFIKASLPKIFDDNEIDEDRVNKKIKKIEGVETESTENKSLFTFYEVHVDLQHDDIKPEIDEKTDPEDEDIPKPYIVTISVVDKKVVAVRRNWEEDDDKFNRREFYVHYPYMPGFGIYSNGLVHILGSNAITLTSILRQLVDAGTLKNFPGGLKTKSARAENNDQAIGPSEFREIETGGEPIRNCVMLMPYDEPSQVLAQLYKGLQEDSMRPAGIANSAIPENSANTPVGTTLAMIEVASKVQSSVLRSLHVSLSYELKLLFNLFGKYLPDDPYPFAVPGQEAAIMRQDFNDKVNIVPVSDPNALTSTHRLLRAEAKLKLAQGNPEIYNMREAHKEMLEAMGATNIDALLPPEETPTPMDPVTENMNLLLGKPLAVGLFQDDDVHNIVHRKFVADLQTLVGAQQGSQPQGQDAPASPGAMQLIAQMMLHIQSHEAYKILKQLQAAGLAPPEIPDEQIPQILLMPDIQNAVALLSAEETLEGIEQAEAQAQAAQEAAANALDITKVSLMDTQQRAEAAQLKAQTDEMRTAVDREISSERAETEAFKAQLKFEGDMAKIEAEKELADEKHEVDLAIEEMKHHPTVE